VIRLSVLGVGARLRVGAGFIGSGLELGLGLRLGLGSGLLSGRLPLGRCAPQPLAPRRLELAPWQEAQPLLARPRPAAAVAAALDLVSEGRLGVRVGVRG
jgi:hypothetical protein